jgi:hypothetical protein
MLDQLNKLKILRLSTENPTVENLILPVMPKAQNRHPTKSSTVCKYLNARKLVVLFQKVETFIIWTDISEKQFQN